MKVVVFGATGVIGRAALEHLADLPDFEVVGVSRRPIDIDGVVHVPIDLSDRDGTADALLSDAFTGTTHVVFTALQESTDLVAGWRDRALMRHNEQLFRNAIEPIARRHNSTLQHLSLLQGAKAYGLHVGRTPLPAKERSPRDAHENFYFLQEDALRSLAEGADWSWTILRPQIVFGLSFASPMNLLPAIGVYAAIEREQGRALSFPGGPPGISEAVDARLLAEVLAWAAVAPAARGEIFNVTNGDVFSWRDTWPAIADVLGMEVGEPVTQRLVETMPRRADEWAAVVDRHGLMAPRSMADFVGGSWTYADMLFGARGTRPLPAVLSTVKLRQAGFAGCIDTEDMFREWFTRFQQLRLLPAV